MATRLYLSNIAALYSPATFRGAWDDSAGSVTKSLVTNKGLNNGVTTYVLRAETNAGAGWDVLLYRGVSGKLDAQTISGTVDICIFTEENSLNADLYYHVHIYVTQGDSDTPRGTLLTDYIDATELGTSDIARSFTSAQTLSSLAVSAGDRIVVEIGYQANNTVTTSYSGALRYGLQNSVNVPFTEDLTVGDSNVTTKAPWIEFSGTVTFNDIAKVTQVGATIVDTSTSNVKVTQVGAMIASTITPDARVTQVGALIIYAYVPPTTGIPAYPFMGSMDSPTFIS